MTNISPKQNKEENNSQSESTEKVTASEPENLSEITELTPEASKKTAKNWWERAGNFWSNQTLRGRLTLVILPTALLPLVLASFFNYWLNWNESKHRIKQELHDRSLLASKATEQLVIEALETPKTLIFNPLVIQAIARANNQPQTREIPETDSENPDISLIANNFELNDYLQQIAKVEEIAEVYILNRYGEIVAYTDRPDPSEESGVSGET